MDPEPLTMTVIFSSECKEYFLQASFVHRVYEHDDGLMIQLDWNMKAWKGFKKYIKKKGIYGTISCCYYEHQCVFFIQYIIISTLSEPNTY